MGKNILTSQEMAYLYNLCISDSPVTEEEYHGLEAVRSLADEFGGTTDDLVGILCRIGIAFMDNGGDITDEEEVRAFVLKGLSLRDIE